LGAGDRFTDKLTVCYAALRDLDRGVILKARGTREPPLSSEIWRLRAVLAVALDYLMRARESLEDAATTVARTSLLQARLIDLKLPIKVVEGQ
jgi:hypothetical protein